MTTHDRVLELAAAAIDFPPTPAEQRALSEHLASCAACARRAAALRSDAVAIGRLPVARLSERRSAEILAAVRQPREVGHPLRLVAIAALLGLLLVGTLIAGAEFARRADRDLTVVPPLPTASPGIDESPAPNATPFLAVDALAWEAIGTLPDAEGLVAAPGGYVAYGNPESTGPVVWFSSDGRAWGEPIPLAALHLNCPGWGPSGDDEVYDADIRGAATTGDEVLLYGTELLFTDSACNDPGASVRMVTWVSRDGRTWERSDGFGDPNARVAGAWPAGSGWHVVDEFAGAVWSSNDGLRWSPMDMDGAQAGVSAPGAADGATVVAMDRLGDDASMGSLVASTGGSWQAIDMPAGCSRPASTLLAPAAVGGGDWVVAGAATACVSSDLERWDVADLATDQRASLTALARTRYGIISSAFCADSTCPQEVTGWQSVSQDGRRWTPLTTSVATRTIVDGPAGVLGLGADGAVWLLTDSPTAASATSQPAEPATTSPSPEPAQLGQEWTEARVPASSGQTRAGTIEAVAAGGPGFVAVGRACNDVPTCEAVVWTSADGRAWERVPGSDATDIGFYVNMSGPGIGMLDVAAGGPGLVGIGYAARPTVGAVAWYSPDGITWERTAIGEPTIEGRTPTTHVNAVTWTGSSYVIVGVDRSDWSGTVDDLSTATARAAAWTSPDGRTWTRVPDGDALDAGGFVDTGEDPLTGGMVDVASGAGGVVAVGAVCTADPGTCTPAAWTSPDGIVWARAAGVPDAAWALRAVAASADGYIAVGDEACVTGESVVSGDCPALVMTSSDGRSWTPVPFPQPGALHGITRVGDQWVAVAPDGDEAVWTSQDGVSWTPSAFASGPATAVPRDVSQFRFAASAGTGVLLTTLAASGDTGAWFSVLSAP